MKFSKQTSILVKLCDTWSFT